METVYKEYSCRRWNYWTYTSVDEGGRRFTLSKTQFDKMVKQGAKVVVVK